MLEHSSVASSLPSNTLLEKSLKKSNSRRHSNRSVSKTEDRLVKENRHLKKEVSRLMEEAREKDALISILESQIMALVVDGRDTDRKFNESSRESDSKSSRRSTKSNTMNRSNHKAEVVEDDDIESDVESAPETKKSSVFTTSTSVTSSL